MSGIHVTCQCGQKFAADSDRAGQSLPCPFCGATIQVPLPEPEASADPPVWHVVLPDGQAIGPVTKTQLERAVADGKLTEDTQIFREGHTAAAIAGDLYPELRPAPTLPAPTMPAAQRQPGRMASRFQQDMDHLVSNPVSYLVSGPKRPAYKKQPLSAGWTALYVLLLLGGGGLGFVLLGINFVVTAQRGADGEALGLAAAFFLLFSAGLFALAGSLFQWSFFFESRKAKGMRDMFGDAAARYIYIVIGSLFVGIPCLISAASLGGGALPQQAAAAKVQELENEERLWKIRRNGDTQEVRGVLEHLSGTGVTISSSSSGEVVGAGFAELSPADREHLREILTARRQLVPQQLAKGLDVPLETEATRPATAANSVATGSANNTNSAAPRVAPSTASSGRPTSVAQQPVSDKRNYGAPPIDPAPSAAADLVTELNLGRVDRFGGTPEVVVAAAARPLVYALDSGELRVYDMLSGEKIKQCRVPNARHLVAGSPSGSRVVVSESLSDYREISVWQIGEDAKLESEWQPHDRIENVDWAALASPDLLLTWTATGTLRAWTFPNRQRVYEVQLSGRPQLTPGGKFLLNCGAETIQFLDVSTGRASGTLQIGTRQTGYQAVVSQDGKRLVARLMQGLGGWDLTTGERFLQTSNNVPGPVISDHWLGSDFVLLGNHLVSLAEQAIVWRFTGRNSILHGQADRAWVTRTYGNDTFLFATSIPDEELRAKIPSSGRPQGTLQPGSQVSIDLQLNAQVPNSEIPGRLKAGVTRKLVEAGLQFAEGQKQKVEVLINETSTGRTIPFYVTNQSESKYGFSAVPTGDAIQVPDRRLSLTVNLVDEFGKKHMRCATSCGTQQVPTQELGLFEKPTVAMVLDKRWDELEKRMDHALSFPTNMWSFAGVGESGFPNPINSDWMDKQADQRQQAAVAERERRAPKIELPEARHSTAWAVSPDPHPALAACLMRRPLAIAEGDVTGIRFASHAGQAAVLIEEEEEDGKPFLHRFTLKDKQRLARTELPKDATLMDFRPDGKVFLLWPDRGQRQVQVWKCAAEADTPFADISLSDERSLKQAAFVGRNGLLLYDGNEIFLRSLPKGELVYRQQLTTLRCYLSWGRKYFVDWVGLRPEIFQTSDGKSAGQLAALPLGSGATSGSVTSTRRDIRCAAFHPDGKTLAILVAGGSHQTRVSTVGIWNLEDGKLLNWFQVPVTNNDMQWTSPQHLLIGTKLFDIEREAAVWEYSGFLPASPDGRGWFIATGRNDVTFLAAIALPSEYVLEAIGQVTEQLPGQLRKRGSISLEVIASLADVDQRAALAARVTEALTERLRDANIDVQPDQRIVLRVSCSKTDSNRDKYRVKSGDTELFVPNFEYSLTLQLMVSFGWQKHLQVGLPSVDYVVDASHADPAADLVRQQEEAFLSAIRSLVIPNLTLPVPDGAFQDGHTFGRSVYDVNGERPAFDVKYRSRIKN